METRTSTKERLDDRFPEKRHMKTIILSFASIFWELPGQGSNVCVGLLPAAPKGRENEPSSQTHHMA